LSHPTMHIQGQRQAAVDVLPGIAALVEGIDESPELACHVFMSKASKEGRVHNPVILLAPIEEGKVGELTLLHARVYGGI
jgi:hypothetical protein